MGGEQDMSNFFRDSSIAFKPRSNIFSKLRVKESEHCSETSLDEDGDTSIMEGLFAKPNENVEGDNTDNTTMNQTPVGEYKNHGKKIDDMHIHSSTPKSASRINADIGGVLEEDELEITEIRNLEPGLVNIPQAAPFQLNTNITPTRSNKQYHDETETSSNDVLLEAFTNTQKICSNLKQELLKQQQENLKLKSQAKIFETDSKRIIERFSEYKKSLSLLEERSKWFMEQKKSNDSRVQDLKRNNKFIQEKLISYKKDIDILKSSLLTIKGLKGDADNDLLSKQKKIEYLKNQLDECSGQLSEEKIKNSSLLMEFSKTRGEISKQNEVFETQITSLTNKLIELLPNDITNLLTTYNEESKDRILKTFEELKTSICHNYDEKLGKTEQTLITFHTENGKNMSASLQNDYSSKIDNLVMDIKSFVSESQNIVGEKFSENFDNLKSELISNNKLSLGKYDLLKTDLSDFKTQVFDCKEYEKKLDSIVQDNCELKLQKTQILASLGTKEAEFEELSRKNNEQNNKLLRYGDEEKELSIRTKELSSELQKSKLDLQRFQEQEVTLISNYDNKLAAQVTIANTLASENDTLKKRINQIEEIKQSLEKENSKKFDKFQNINEQVNRLNIEVVQLKARELELEEENRNLKKSVDDDRTGYEETCNDVKRFKQRIILLESDKQEFVSERLELQDKIEELQIGIKVLKKQNKDLTSEQNEISNQSKENAPKPQVAILMNRKKFISNSDNCTAAPKNNVESNEVKQSAFFPQRQETMKSKEQENADEFDLSSSMNDDLEMTIPSPIEVKQVKRKKGGSQIMKAPCNSRKKLLIQDEEGGTSYSQKRRKKRG